MRPGLYHSSWLKKVDVEPTQFDPRMLFHSRTFYYKMGLCEASVSLEFWVTPPFPQSKNARAGDCTCYGGPLLSFGGGDFEVLVKRLFHCGPYIPSPPKATP